MNLTVNGRVISAAVMVGAGYGIWTLIKELSK